MPIQPFPSMLRRETGGTVKRQTLHFNTAAQNGTWLAYELVDDDVAAWFVCHSDVDPETEIDKILRVSGSPYEPDSGSDLFNEKTAAEGVLPINRYDWGWYDKRCQEDVQDAAVVSDSNMEDYVFGEHVGLVDYGHAEEYVEKWKDMKAHDRENSEHGIWMTIGLEYMFGRFGFNDEHTAARSFLWFTSNTEFTQTKFAGMERTLRIYESDEERFQRYLKEGVNFDGLELIRKLDRWGSLASKVPPETECLGPYDASEYILHTADVDVLRTRPGVKAPDFPAQWKDASMELINNMLMSYLERVMGSASSAHDTTALAAASLFPKYETDRTDQCLYGLMTRPNSDPIEGFDKTAVGVRIKKFLTPRCADNSLIRDGEFIAGLVPFVAFWMSEMLELANNCRLDNSVSGIVPSHLRLVVTNDKVMLDMFRFTKVYWYGGLIGWVAVKEGVGEGDAQRTVHEGEGKLAEQVTQS